MSSEYLAAVKARRTHYSLSKESPIDGEKIKEIIGQAVFHALSSFKEHDKVWDIAKTALKAVVPSDQYPATEQKLSMFQGAYGTVC